MLGGNGALNALIWKTLERDINGIVKKTSVSNQGLYRPPQSVLLFTGSPRDTRSQL